MSDSTGAAAGGGTVFLMAEADARVRQLEDFGGKRACGDDSLWPTPV